MDFISLADEAQEIWEISSKYRNIAEEGLVFTLPPTQPTIFEHVVGMKYTSKQIILVLCPNRVYSFMRENNDKLKKKKQMKNENLKTATKAVFVMHDRDLQKWPSFNWMVREGSFEEWHLN